MLPLIIWLNCLCHKLKRHQQATRAGNTVETDTQREPLSPEVTGYHTYISKRIADQVYNLHTQAATFPRQLFAQINIEEWEKSANVCSSYTGLNIQGYRVSEKYSEYKYCSEKYYEESIRIPTLFIIQTIKRIKRNIVG